MSTYALDQFFLYYIHKWKVVTTVNENQKLKNLEISS